MDITITIPDAQLARVRDAIASLNGYTGTDPQGSPETKNQFAKRMLVRWIKSQVKLAEQPAAVSSVDTSVESIAIT